MRYLDPKADLTFKKIFNNAPLLMSLLNALLPLDKGEEVMSVEYLPAEMVPRTPTGKDTIVDVRCMDNRGRQFIVEMQMVWSTEYKQRMVFNAAKAYVGQLNKAEDYKLLQPVYSLNLVDDIFEKDVQDWYHYYRLVHNRYDNKVIEGLHLVLVELPKFTPHTMTEKKMAVLWLRFLTEIGEQTGEVPQELLDNAEVKEAIEIVEESAYSKEEMMTYERFWDVIRVEKARANEAETRYYLGLEKGKVLGHQEGLQEGKALGHQEGLQEGKALGHLEGLMEVAKNMLAKGLSVDAIAQMTGLSQKEVERLQV